MGRFKTHEERTKKKMEKNPMRYLPEAINQPNENSTPQTELDPVAAEKQRLIGLIFKNKDFMTAEYKVLVRHTGSLVAGSMVVAYDKAFNDIIKLLLKETSK